MWPDHFSKRKPVSLGGTPANKFIAIVCLSTVVSYVVAVNALSYTPFLKKKIVNVRNKVIQGEEDKKVKAFLGDPLVQGAIQRKKKEYEETSDPFGF